MSKKPVKENLRNCRESNSSYRNKKGIIRERHQSLIT